MTYISMACGLAYLINWYSCKTLSWRLSNILALEEAITQYGTPEIFNTDPGSQFTSDDFTRLLKANDIHISMDGKGRWLDNVFVKWLWRSLKEVCLCACGTGTDARRSIGVYLDFFNAERWHQ